MRETCLKTRDALQGLKHTILFCSVLLTIQRRCSTRILYAEFARAKITMSTDQQRLRAVTNHTAEYIHQWCSWSTGYTAASGWGAATLGVPDVTCQVLIAAGRGPARLPSCEHVMRHVSTEYSTSAPSKKLVDVRPLLRRTASLFGVGELRELRVAHPSVIEFIISSLLQREFEVLDPDHQAVAAATTTEASSALEQALNALCVVAWPTEPKLLDAVATSLIERHAATITALDCIQWSTSEAADRAVARCTQLQSLSWAKCYAPSSWLQCTQLHTLRNVNLAVVSVAAIAAALPRLHTLTASIARFPPEFSNFWSNSQNFQNSSEIPEISKKILKISKNSQMCQNSRKTPEIPGIFPEISKNF
jgi:hypothetical protein